MPLSPSSSVQEARKAVARRLREARLDARPTGPEAAQRCGWHPAKSSRIENARATPSDDDIRAWCTACGAEGQIEDLIAASRTADSMYVEWRQLHRAGMRKAQEDFVPLSSRPGSSASTAPTWCPASPSQEYAAAPLTMISEFQQTPDGSAQAAAARVARSHVIREGDHRFALLIEEDILYRLFGNTTVMAGQLGYLLADMALPSVSLGVLPRRAPRRMWTLETFTIFDTQRVHVELLTAKVTVTQPSEIAAYIKTFERMSQMAVYGERARRLITAAIDSLG
ncbi:Scr1 family TA system antitoxin-like transcriptional regulator [Streptomyces sp. H27-D2]|uniref:Scr1 family TA system antitoxin-like transcriptional regulator n=1 Tax=Streptomyces sp. H27-D2 TaxID=3046304 RepID=UPI002DBFA984|nr:Scr1 family TA system antitoxin-like transcriptional regulator [Streptomyces sp. H27-D2]MEC4018075.1 Scr1 family TA system antitoxin-like transcriptional regulator [Streptomyces sp. H27-D2]